MNRRNFFSVIAAPALVGALDLTAPRARATAFAPNGDSSPFSDNVQVTVTDACWIVKSDGIPNHTTAVFPNKDNPNRILKQDYTFYISRKPTIATKPTVLPMGPIGVAINGIPFYNPYNAEGNDAVNGLYAEVFDSCCGHPDQMGRYHYHKYPLCIKTPFHDAPGKHSPRIGFAFDGFAIYGPQSENGKFPADLDPCSGHSDNVRGYHYHVTATYPYIIGGCRGEPDPRNFDHPGMHQRRGNTMYPMDRHPADAAQNLPHG